MAKGTKANVQYFDGTDGPAKPKKISGSHPNVKLPSAKGKDAGGRENMKADGKKFRSDPFSAPESGKPKYRPGGVRNFDGTRAPNSAAKGPK